MLILKQILVLGSGNGKILDVDWTEPGPAALLTHDIFEHDLTNDSGTFEDEFIALGGVVYCRGEGEYVCSLNEDLGEDAVKLKALMTLSNLLISYVNANRELRLPSANDRLQTMSNEYVSYRRWLIRAIRTLAILDADAHDYFSDESNLIPIYKLMHYGFNQMRDKYHDNSRGDILKTYHQFENELHTLLQTQPNGTIVNARLNTKTLEFTFCHG